MCRGTLGRDRQRQRGGYHSCLQATVCAHRLLRRGLLTADCRQPRGLQSLLIPQFQPACRGDRWSPASA